MKCCYDDDDTDDTDDDTDDSDDTDDTDDTDDEDDLSPCHRETFAYLDKDCFARFTGAASSPSNEYAALLSSMRLKTSSNVKNYLRKASFLQEVLGASELWPYQPLVCDGLMD